MEFDSGCRKIVYEREDTGCAVPKKRERRNGICHGGRDGHWDKASKAFIPDGREPAGHKHGRYHAVFGGKWNCQDTGRYSGGGRTAGAVWAAGLLQSLSLPPLSEKPGGEILQRIGGEILQKAGRLKPLSLPLSSA